MSTLIADDPNLIREFQNYLDSACSVHHAVDALKGMLNSQIHSNCYYDALTMGSEQSVVECNGDSSIAYIRFPKSLDKDHVSILICAAHVDSPVLRLRPNFTYQSESLEMASVETYGAGLWHTWLDRDLSLAGSVYYKNDHFVEKLLYKSPHPCGIIPNLAIHLQTAEERQNIRINPELHLNVVACDLESKLLDDIHSKIGSCEILSHDLSFFDSQKSNLIGLDQNLLTGSRLDNLTSTYLIFRSLRDVPYNKLSDHHISIAVAFDHEEVGSLSAQGAQSSWIHSLLDRVVRNVYSRITDTSTEDNAYLKFKKAVLSRSFLVSADAAHAVHPNYAMKYQALNKPVLNGGIVIKHHPAQRYCTTASTTACFLNFMKEHKLETQFFTTRNDTPCGSTIGPMLAAQLNIRGIDIGIPVLAMHSIRETCGVLDLYRLSKCFDLLYSSDMKWLSGPQT